MDELLGIIGSNVVPGCICILHNYLCENILSVNPTVPRLFEYANHMFSLVLVLLDLLGRAVDKDKTFCWYILCCS